MLKILMTALALSAATGAEANFTLTLSTSGPVSSAVIVSSPTGISSSSFSASFAEGSTVTLSMSPSSTTAFSGWGGDGCTTNLRSCNVLMSTTKTVTAKFNPVLSVRLSGNGLGTVTTSSGEVNCSWTNGCASGSAVTQAYSSGTVVHLHAVADSSSSFSGWSGVGGCSVSSTCTVTMNNYKSAVATFTSAGPFLVRVARGGTGRGTITSVPAGIDCGDTCASSFSLNTVITFTATPSTGSTFVGWANGGCASTGTCVVTSTSAQQGLGGKNSPSGWFY